jgi:hypothetical protein
MRYFGRPQPGRENPKVNALGQGRRIAAVLSMAGMIILAVSGCGKSGTPQTSTGSGTTAAATSPATVQATSTPKPPPTGTKLNSLLLNASAFPAGFAIITSGTRNSADSTAPDSPSPMPTSQWCIRLAGTSWIDIGGITGATWAEREYENSSKTESIGEEIDTFTGTDAKTVMAELWKVFGHCKTFTENYSGMAGRTTTVRHKLPGVESQAIKLVETSPTFLGGNTLVAVRVGNAIVTLVYSSEHSDLGSPAVTWAERIGRRLKAAS